MKKDIEYQDGNLFTQAVVEGLREYVQSVHKGNVSSAKKALNMGSTLDAWLNGTRVPSLSKSGPILERLGARIVFPEKGQPISRDVCFVNARAVPAGEGGPPIVPEDYMAVPVVDEVGAGPGVIPQEGILSWFLVYKHQDAVRYKSDLVAVQIAKNSTSMEPTLHPRDIVLVDRQDRDVSFPGRIMLVMDADGSGMIKRVAVEEIDGGRDWRIMYYSDNAAENPPSLYSLRHDFMGEWDRAIVGRVVWAWSDVSKK